MSEETFSEEGFVPLFDGESTSGWRAIPRILGTTHPGGPDIHSLLDKYGMKIPEQPEKYPARWFMEDGILIGEQAKEKYGGYLVSEKTYSEFELAFDAKPDWPADTGVMLRRNRDSFTGIQVLIDHRKSGTIGQFFGNGLASFHAVNFAVDVERDQQGKLVGLKLEDPATSKEPVTQQKIDALHYACDPKEFIKAWKWADWNSFRIRCVGGPLPIVTTWINGLKIAELNLGTLAWPDFDAKGVANALGPAGHIAFEVHDNDSYLGDDRWGKGAQCRWRNVRLKDLSSKL